MIEESFVTIADSDSEKFLNSLQIWKEPRDLCTNHGIVQSGRSLVSSMLLCGQQKANRGTDAGCTVLVVASDLESQQDLGKFKFNFSNHNVGRHRRGKFALASSIYVVVYK